MIEVEEGGLRALEQHVLAGLERLVDEVDRVGDVGLQPGRQTSRYGAAISSTSSESWL